jgi:hypothetical protein
MDDTTHDAAIAAAIAAEYTAPPRGTPFDINTIYRIVFRAGYAAGSADLAVARASEKQLRKVLKAVPGKARLARELCTTAEDNAGLLMSETVAAIDAALKGE